MNNTILQFKMSVYIQVFKKQTALAFFLEMPIFLLNSRKHTHSKFVRRHLNSLAQETQPRKNMRVFWHINSLLGRIYFKDI